MHLARATAGPNRKEGKPDCRHVARNTTRLTESLSGDHHVPGSDDNIGRRARLACCVKGSGPKLLVRSQLSDMVRKGKIEIDIR